MTGQWQRRQHAALVGRSQRTRGGRSAGPYQHGDGRGGFARRPSGVDQQRGWHGEAVGATQRPDSCHAGGPESRSLQCLPDGGRAVCMQRSWRRDCPHLGGCDWAIAGYIARSHRRDPPRGIAGWTVTGKLWRRRDGSAVDQPSGRLLQTLVGHASAAIDVALAGDKQLVASRGADASVRVWDVRNGRAMAVLHGHSNAVRGVALSLNGRLLASGGADGTVRLWDVLGGRSLATLLGHTSTVMRVALSADGRLLASGSGDSTVRLWDVPSGSTLATLQGHSSTVFGLSLSADGRLLASASGDGTVKLWETGSGTCVATLRTEPCYERLDITGVTGVTTAQRAALLALGAIEQPLAARRSHSRPPLRQLTTISTGSLTATAISASSLRIACNTLRIAVGSWRVCR